MKKEILYAIILSLLIVIIILFIGLLTLDKLDESIVYMECCDGSPCTDTYYTAEDNLCHLVLCESSTLIKNKSQCVYEGAGIWNVSYAD